MHKNVKQLGLAVGMIATFFAGTASAGAVVTSRAPLEVTCDFLSGLQNMNECTAQIDTCARVPGPQRIGCENHLRVFCDGSEIYNGPDLSTQNAVYALVQGITSPENPLPPAIVIKTPGTPPTYPATLSTSQGRISGQCTVASPAF